MKTRTKHAMPYIFLSLILSLFFVRSLSQEKTIVTPVLSTIVLDPGHGGEDPGAVAQGIQEKDIVLDIALRLGNLIKENYPTIKVIFTRNSDSFIPLYERANIANKNKADLFISIHANYFRKPSISGTETFVLGLHRSEENLEVAKKENSVILLEKDYSTIYEGFDPNSPESYIMFELVQDEYLDQSIMVASSVQEQFVRFARLEDRGVKQAGFIVLKRTAMPGILIETGFLTNPHDRDYLLSNEGKTNLTVSIMRAVSIYIRKVEDKTGIFLAEKPDSATVSSIPAPIKKKPEVPSEKTIAGSVKTHIQSIDNKWYVVQVAASVKPIDIKPENFKGERNIFSKKIGIYYKYYSNKFKTIPEAKTELRRAGQKFPGAFIVVFDGENVYPLKK